jgi:hypothetical protein
MVSIILALIGIAIATLGISAFIKLKYLDVAASYWNNKRSKNGNPLSPLRKKLTAIGYIFSGLLIILISWSLYLDQQHDKEKEDHIKNEAKRLNIPVEEYRTIDSAFLFMPKNSTVDDYKKVDEKAKKLGFNNGYDYLLEEYSAKKKGKTIEDVISERRAKQEKEAAEKKAKQEKEAAEKAAEAKMAQAQARDSSAMASIPQGEFYTDRGQVSLDVYRAACNHAFANKKSIVTELSVAWTHSPEGKLASNIGESAISNTQIWWDEESQKCYGSYTISGLADGNNYSLKFSGKVQSFYNSGGGTISGNISRF